MRFLVGDRGELLRLVLADERLDDLVESIGMPKEKLEEVMRDTLASALDRAGDQSLRSMLSGSSLEHSWRLALEKQLADAIWPFVESQGFANWLASVIGSRPSGGP